MSEAKSDTDLLADISRKLDSVLAFLAANAVQSDDSAVLKRLYENGHSAQEIGRIIGITENAAAIRLTRLRKKAGKAHSKAHKNDKSTTETGPAG